MSYSTCTLCCVWMFHKNSHRLFILVSRKDGEKERGLFNESSHTARATTGFLSPLLFPRLYLVVYLVFKYIKINIQSCLFREKQREAGSGRESLRVHTGDVIKRRKKRQSEKITEHSRAGLCFTGAIKSLRRRWRCFEFVLGSSPQFLAGLGVDSLLLSAIEL